MNFSLVFENTGDLIPFKLTANQQLFEFFVDKINRELRNSFFNKNVLARRVDTQLNELHWAITKTNEVFNDLTGYTFNSKSSMDEYLDQSFLNKTHAEWVQSQFKNVNIDSLRFNSNHFVARLGAQLHEMYPDEIRPERIAPVLEKLGYLYPYERINLSVHELESCFSESNLEFQAVTKWDVFDNPFRDSMISNNDITNFSFSYTYVGRQYYNKFEYFDDNLECNDHYNFETLECAFQLSLRKPQTIPYSKEFIEWADTHNVEHISTQLPIGNIVDLNKKLFDYRKVLYRNSKDNNSASIIIHQ